MLEVLAINNVHGYGLFLGWMSEKRSHLEFYYDNIEEGEIEIGCGRLFLQVSRVRSSKK